MVDEEAVGLVARLAIASQDRAHGLGFLARVHEHQAFAPARALEDVADARIGVLRGHVGGGEQRMLLGVEDRDVSHGTRRGRQLPPVVRAARAISVDALDREHVRLLDVRGALQRPLARLRTLDIEMLHREAPDAPRLLEPGDDASASRSGGEEGTRALRISYGCRKADAPRIDARHTGETLDEAERLAAPVPAQERVDLVDNDVAQVVEQAGHEGVLVQQERLERFRRYLEDAARMLQHLRLMRSGNVPVPVPHRDTGFLAEVVQAHELVVDERFERSDVDRPDACGRVLPEFREDGEEGGFGLSRGGAGGEQHVLVRVEDRFGRGDLDRPQALPAAAVDEILDERRIAVERCHRPLLSQSEHAFYSSTEAYG